MRDKLIGLIFDSAKLWRYPVGNGYLFDYGKLADHLIANGVKLDVPDTNVGKWIPVSEPPKENGKYLVLFKDGDMCSADYNDSEEPEERFGIWNTFFDPEEVDFYHSEWIPFHVQELTHWCVRPELPEPPKEGSP